MEQTGIVTNTTDPAETLQIQTYAVNAKVVSSSTSLSALNAEIANLEAQLNSLKSLQSSITTALANAGVTDTTQPLTQAQIDTLTSAGYVTTAV